MRALALSFLFLTIAQGALFSFDFKPNVAQSIPNPLGSAISLKCIIKSTDASDVLFGHVLSGTANVNGQTVPSAGISFTVKNADVMTLQSSASSEISITNKGTSLVHADCDFAEMIESVKASNSFLSFDFHPNVAQSIPNPLGWSINLKCHIVSSDASDVMVGKMLAGTGSVNGKTVPSAGVTFTVHNGDVISISGSASSTVSITNQGSTKVHADCDLALSEPAPSLMSFDFKASNSFLSFDFHPNVAQSIPNPLGWSINLKCHIVSSDASDVMVGKMLAGTGSVNGKTVPSAGVTFTVHNGDVISISGSASSTVSITNQGSTKVHADCDLALSEPAPNSLMSFDFQPNTAKSIPNPLGSDITLKCTITANDASDVLTGKMISGTGSVNGQTIPSTGASFTVHNGDVLTIVSSGSGELSLTNQGASTVHADCDLAATTLGSSNSFLSFDFQPSTAKSIPNPIGVDLTLKCTLTSTDATDTLVGKMVSGTGSVNGHNIPATGLSFTIKNGDVVTIESTAGSELSILNKGAKNVHADCNLAQSLESSIESDQKNSSEKHHRKHHRREHEEGIEREMRKVVYRFRKWRKSD